MNVQIHERLLRLNESIQQASEKAQRSLDEIRLVAISKTKPADVVREAFKAGQLTFGENRVQEAIEKIKIINRPEIVWHFIDPIQSNKTNQIARYFDWVHTVDRIKIARRLDKMRPENLPPLNICIQVNTSREVTKSGISIEEVEDFIDEIKDYEHIKVRGLMSLPKIK